MKGKFAKKLTTALNKKNLKDFMRAFNSLEEIR